MTAQDSERIANVTAEPAETLAKVVEGGKGKGGGTLESVLL